MTDEETKRVSMLWPADLKELAQKTAKSNGDRNLTDFTIEAVRQQLELDGDLRGVNKELNETRHFAQVLADTLVRGGDKDDRLNALMEIEFPSWIDTTGWPGPMADRVRPAPIFAEPTDEPIKAVTRDEELLEEVAGSGSTSEPLPEPASEPAPEERKSVGEDALDRLKEQREQNAANAAAKVNPLDIPHDTTGDDLLSRVMAAKAGDLADIPGLKTAAELPVPEKPPVEPEPEPAVEPVAEAVEEPVTAAAGICPACGDLLVEGECWTCSF